MQQWRQLVFAFKLYIRKQTEASQEKIVGFF